MSGFSGTFKCIFTKATVCNSNTQKHKNNVFSTEIVISVGENQDFALCFLFVGQVFVQIITLQFDFCTNYHSID